MVIPAPRNSRELFQMFLLYDGDLGIEALVDKLHFDSADRRQIYFSALGRAPENPALSLTPPGYNPAAHLRDTLLSREFQQSFHKLLCRAFPEYKRSIFLHIPKCAGTDLAAILRQNTPSIAYSLVDENWTPKPALFAAIRKIVLELNFSRALCLYGHLRLEWLIRQDLIRFEDDCFTIVRDPFDIVLSQVNYVLTRLMRAAADPIPPPDVTTWLRLLDIHSVEPNTSPSKLVKLAKLVLRHSNIVPRDTTCHYLGRSNPEGHSSADAATDNLVVANVEITNTTRYNTWLKEKYGISSTTRHNQSNKILTRDNMSEQEREYVSEITAQDRQLYSKIGAALDAQGTSSIRGRALA